MKEEKEEEKHIKNRTELYVGVGRRWILFLVHRKS